MQKLRFATAIPEFSKKKGGAEKYLVDLCAQMAEEGHEVDVYAEHWDEENPKIHFHFVKTLLSRRAFGSFLLRSRRQKR